MQVLYKNIIKLAADPGSGSGGNDGGSESEVLAIIRKIATARTKEEVDGLVGRALAIIVNSGLKPDLMLYTLIMD